MLPGVAVADVVDGEPAAGAHADKSKTTVTKILITV
jgi:hypothetical protein